MTHCAKHNIRYVGPVCPLCKMEEEKIKNIIHSANDLNMQRIKSGTKLDMMGQKIIKKVSFDEFLKETPKITHIDRPKILFLAANPKKTVKLRLDEEVREIDHQIMLAQKKDQLILINKGAVRASDLLLYLNQEQPSIVHFSGHGTVEGKIILENDYGEAKLVTSEALSKVFKVLKDNLCCVILNACFSMEQAKSISRHIDCVIGMSETISDDAAIKFASAFYLAIASERSIKEAFDQGISRLMLEGIAEENIPQLISGENIDPLKIYLLKKNRK